MANSLAKRERKRFLEEMVEHGNMKKACAAIERGRTTVYNAMQNDEEFGAAVKLARQHYLDDCADTATDLALNGFVIVSEIRDKKGAIRQRQIIKRPDLRTLVRILERRHPDFKPEQSINLKAGGVLFVPVAPDTMEDFEKQYATGSGETS